MASKQAKSFVKGTVQKRPPTPKMVKAAKLMAENGGREKPLTNGEIMKQAGYSPTIQETPSKITRSEAFQNLLDEFMPDDDLAAVHKRLLQTRKIEHMVFPLEHQDPDMIGIPLEGDIPEELEQQMKAKSKRIIDTLTDQDIIDMLAEVNCKVKRIVHGETARHVWYWAHDANAQSKALDMAYKMKGYQAQSDEKSPINFNFGVQNFVKNGEDKS